MGDKVQIEILPLSSDALDEATSLLKNIFISHEDQKIFPLSLIESLSEEDSKKTYWVAVTFDGKVIGITGLYYYSRDKKTVWLGWFGVHPEHRRQGIGSALLKFAINEAKRRDFSTIKLYTSSDENEIDSHALYKRYGFVHSYNNQESGKLFFVKSIANQLFDKKGCTLMHEIEIQWEGPLSLEEVEAKSDGKMDPSGEGEDYGLYQIYGKHILGNKDALLYIGKATERTFFTRMSEHRKGWLDGEENIQIFIGRIYDPNKHSVKDDWFSWKEDIGLAEKILIYKYSPHYTSEHVANSPSLNGYESVQIIHKGNKGKLKNNDVATKDYS